MNATTKSQPINSDWKDKLIGNVAPSKVDGVELMVKIFRDKKLLDLYGPCCGELERPYMVTSFDENEVKFYRNPYTSKYSALGILMEYIFNPNERFSSFAIESEDSLDSVIMVDGKEMTRRTYKFGESYERNSNRVKDAIRDCESGKKYLEIEKNISPSEYSTDFLDVWNFVSEQQKNCNQGIFSIVTEIIRLAQGNGALVKKLENTLSELDG